MHNRREPGDGRAQWLPRVEKRHGELPGVRADIHFELRPPTPRRNTFGPPRRSLSWFSYMLPHRRVFTSFCSTPRWGQSKRRCTKRFLCRQLSWTYIRCNLCCRLVRRTGSCVASSCCLLIRFLCFLLVLCSLLLFCLIIVTDPRLLCPKLSWTYIQCNLCCLLVRRTGSCRASHPYGVFLSSLFLRFHFAPHSYCGFLSSPCFRFHFARVYVFFLFSFFSFCGVGTVGFATESDGVGDGAPRP